MAQSSNKMPPRAIPIIRKNPAFKKKIEDSFVDALDAQLLKGGVKGYLQSAKIALQRNLAKRTANQADNVLDHGLPTNWPKRPSVSKRDLKELAGSSSGQEGGEGAAGENPEGTDEEGQKGSEGDSEKTGEEGSAPEGAKKEEQNSDSKDSSDQNAGGSDGKRIKPVGQSQEDFDREGKKLEEEAQERREEREEKKRFAKEREEIRNIRGEDGEKGEKEETKKPATEEKPEEEKDKKKTEKDKISKEEEDQKARDLNKARGEKKKKTGFKAQVQKAVDESAKAARKGTGEALKQSWLNILDSIGLTLIYINFHFIMYYLGGPFKQFFCQPGSEWFAGTGLGALAGGEGADTGKTTSESASTSKTSEAETKKGEANAAEEENDQMTGSSKGGASNLGLIAAQYLEIILLVICDAIVIGLIFLVIIILYALISCDGRTAIFGSALPNLGPLNSVLGSVASMIPLPFTCIK